MNFRALFLLTFLLGTPGLVQADWGGEPPVVEERLPPEEGPSAREEILYVVLVGVALVGGTALLVLLSRLMTRKRLASGAPVPIPPSVEAAARERFWTRAEAD